MSDCRKTELSVTEVPCGTPVLLHCMFTNALTGIKLFQVFLLLNLFRVFFLPVCTLLAHRHPGEGLGPCCCADINQSNSPEQHALQGQWAEGDGGVVLAGTWAKAACTSPVHGGVITSVMTGGLSLKGDYEVHLLFVMLLRNSCVRGEGEYILLWNEMANSLGEVKMKMSIVNNNNNKRQGPL